MMNCALAMQFSTEFMNSISIETILRLGKLADLQSIKLRAEGWTDKSTPAVGNDRYGRVIFQNGDRHELALPVGRLVKWTRLLPDRPGSHLEHTTHGAHWVKDPPREIGIDFDKDGQLLVCAGSSQLIFRARTEEQAQTKVPLPIYMLDAGPSHNTEFKLLNQPDGLDDELKAARVAKLTQSQLRKIANARVAEKDALKHLKDEAAAHCKRMAKMEAMTPAQAVSEAKAYREARRFVRRLLSNPTEKPAFLKTVGDVIPGREGYEAREDVSESAAFDLRCSEYLEANRKLVDYKPRSRWGRAIESATEKKTCVMRLALGKLNGVLLDAAKRVLAEQTAGQYPEKSDWDDFRTIPNAAYNHGGWSYHKARQYVRQWPQDKAKLVVAFMEARTARIDAEAMLTRARAKVAVKTATAAAGIPVEPPVSPTAETPMPDFSPTPPPETETQQKDQIMPVKVTLKRDKECKGSVRFATDDEKAPVTNVYLMRTHPAAATAKEITITVEA